MTVDFLKVTLDFAYVGHIIVIT